MDGSCYVQAGLRQERALPAGLCKRPEAVAARRQLGEAAGGFYIRGAIMVRAYMFCEWLFATLPTVIFAGILMGLGFDVFGLSFKAGFAIGALVTTVVAAWACASSIT